MKRIINISFIFLICIFLNSCSSDITNQNSEKLEVKGNDILYKHKNISTEEAYIYFGVTPWKDDEKMAMMYKPMMEYFSEQMGVKFDLCISPTYEQLKDDLKEGSIDIAAFSPAAFADAIATIKDYMTYIASYIEKGKESYLGYIFTRSNSSINTIEDLKGKSFGFVSEKSASGYLYPVAMLLKDGIDPYKYFKRVKFSGTHDNVIKEVKEGVIDVGATWDGSYDPVIKKEGPIFKIIKQTPEIPYDGIVTSKSSKKITPEFLEKFTQVLKNTSIKSKTKDGKNVMDKELEFPYTGFVFKDFSAYDVVIETQKIVNDYKSKQKK